jgi:hypothetical protein
MAILSKGATIVADTQISATNLNNLVDAATFVSGAVDGTTTQLSGGAIIVKDGGITPAKLSTGGPSWTSGGTLSATAFSGPLAGAVTGNVTGNLTGNSAGTHTGAVVGNVTGDVTGNASTATKIASITNSDIVQLTASQTLTNKTLTSPTITGTGAIAGNFTGPITGNISSSIADITLLNLIPETGYPTSGTITLNLAAASNAVIQLGGNSTFALSAIDDGQINIVALKNVTGGTITTSWPAWTSAGGSFPASLTAGQAMVVSLYSYGTTTGSVYAVSSL